MIKTAFYYIANTIIKNILIIIVNKRSLRFCSLILDILIHVRTCDGVITFKAYASKNTAF